MTIWTAALSTAAKAVRDEPQPHPYWPESDIDVRSRAREFAGHPVGSELKPFQREYLVAFTQRLDNAIGGRHTARPSHAAFIDALNAADKEA